jgi:hypothetical protein
MRTDAEGREVTAVDRFCRQYLRMARRCHRWLDGRGCARTAERRLRRPKIGEVGRGDRTGPRPDAHRCGDENDPLRLRDPGILWEDVFDDGIDRRSDGNASRERDDGEEREQRRREQSRDGMSQEHAGVYPGQGAARLLSGTKCQARALSVDQR